MTPDYAPGCKRILISNDYYPALQQPNCELVTDGIVEVRPQLGRHRLGRGARGRHDHLRHRLPRHRPADRRADPRRRAASRSPSARAAARRPSAAPPSPAIPNLFLLLGPNTGLGHMSVVFMAEAQADYIAAALRRMRSEGIASLEVKRARLARATTTASSASLEGTVWNEGGCASWYTDAQRPQHDAVARLRLPLPPQPARLRRRLLRRAPLRARREPAAGAAAPSARRWRHERGARRHRQARPDHRRRRRHRLRRDRRAAKARRQASSASTSTRARTARSSPATSATRTRSTRRSPPASSASAASTC